MGALASKLAGFAKSIVKSVKEFPLETLLGVAFFAFYIYTKKEAWEFELIWFFPLFVLCFTLHKFKNRNILLRILFYLSWFVWIPLYKWGWSSSEWYDWTVGIAYLLSGIALIIGTEKMENVPFGRNAISVVVRLAETLFVGLVLWGIIMAVVASVDFLFGLSLKEGWYGYPALINWLIVVPVIGCNLLSKSTELTRGINLLRIVIDLILSPALILYAVILYGYIIRILLAWELPAGGVAYMVLAFMCVALVCYLLRLQVENRHFELFFKAFPAIAVPPMLLLWIGIFRRIGEYGLTDSRFYLLILAILVTAFVVMLVKERTRRFQLMALIVAVAAILFTFIPGIRSKDFGIRSQMARLDKMLPDILEDGKFPADLDYAALFADSVQCKKVKESYGAWSYLKDQLDTASFRERYGDYGNYNVEPWKLERKELDLGYNRVWSLESVGNLIDLGPYTQLVRGFNTYQDSLGIAFCRGSYTRDTLIYCPVREMINKADENTPVADILIYENGRYKAILQTVNEYGKNLYCGSAVVVKKP